jgi:uncharacterized protein YeaO (DUF488 family)
MKRARKAARSPRRPARAKTRILIKRAYDPPGREDGMRILIDRLWPRGVSKSALRIDAWPREITPSTELRRWYHHEPERFAEFRERYLAELSEHGDRLDELRAAVRGKTATLLTATRDVDYSHAVVLRDVLARRSKRT